MGRVSSLCSKDVNSLIAFREGFCFFFFSRNFVYLFYFWLSWVLLLLRLFCSVESGAYSSWSGKPSHCSGFSLQSTGSRAGELQQLRLLGSRAQAQQLWRTSFSHSAACGIVPDGRWNPCILHWHADSLPLSHQGSPKREFLMSVLGRELQGR